MALGAGARLGPYEVVELLGLGGMGEVYRAQDTRLNRVVAIKVMPPHVAADAEMKERFDREAQTIAGLNHPNICVLHDVGSAPAAAAEQAVNFIVMEFLEGETLEQRLERVRDPSSASRLRSAPPPLSPAPARAEPGSGSGTRSGTSRSTTKPVSRPFTVEESLGVAIQIADALDKAHSSGIIHRDLKPANVMLLAGGSLGAGVPHVKLLDFGLAKWTPTSHPLASALTVQADLTAKGAVLGTMRYMAPEQLEGEEADARTDIFAFGSILYEVLTGKKAFDGKNQPSLAGAIMTSEPTPISRLQPLAPPALERVIKRCLAKDRDDRWQTAHDLLIQLRWIAERGSQEAAAGAAKTQKTSWLVKGAIAAGLVLTAAAVWPAYLFMQGPAPVDPIQFRVSAFGLVIGSTAISPDGRTLAIAARPNTQEPGAVYFRPVGATTFRRVAGADDPSYPFWSPDSKTAAFASGGRLKKADAAGGSPRDIAEVPSFVGGSWSRDNVILFGSATGLYRVSAEGGRPESVTAVEKPETGHYWPAFLPDGRHFLYTVWSDDPSKRAVMVGSLDSKERKLLMAADTNMVYASAGPAPGSGPGYVLFRRETNVFAQRFDADNQVLTGEAVQIAGDVAFNAATGRGAFDASLTGAMLYSQGTGGPSGRSGVDTRGIVVYGIRDRSGQLLAQVGEQGSYGDIDWSPDGTRVAVTRQDAGSPGSDIWVTDWSRNVSHVVTLDPADDMNPVWAPDGQRIAFTSFRNGNADVFVMNADGHGDAVPLLNSPVDEYVEDWSKDGRFIAYKLVQENSVDLYVLPLEPDGKPGKPIPVVQGKYRKDEPQFSYDGQWIAYTADASGAFQVYVIKFPELTPIHQVTPPEGGGQPRWRKDGTELFYRVENRMMVAAIKLGATVTSGVPRQMFLAANVGAARDPIRHQWSASPDGQQFLIRLPLNSGTAGGLIGGRSGVPVLPPNFDQVQSGAGPPTTNPLNHGLTVILGWPAAMTKGSAR